MDKMGIEALTNLLTEKQRRIEQLEEIIKHKDKIEMVLFNESYHLDKCLQNALDWVWEHTGEDDEYYLDVCRNYIGLNDNEMKKEQEELDSR